MVRWVEVLLGTGGCCCGEADAAEMRSVLWDSWFWRWWVLSTREWRWDWNKEYERRMMALSEVKEWGNILRRSRILVYARVLWLCHDDINRIIVQFSRLNIVLLLVDMRGEVVRQLLTFWSIGSIGSIGSRTVIYLKGRSWRSEEQELVSKYNKCAWNERFIAFTAAKTPSDENQVSPDSFL
jgi:hypothetical protein